MQPKIRLKPLKNKKQTNKAEKSNWNVICLPPSGVSKISPHLSRYTKTLISLHCITHAFFLQSGGVCGLGTSSPWCARSQQWRENTALSHYRCGEGWGQSAGWHSAVFTEYHIYHLNYLPEKLSKTLLLFIDIPPTSWSCASQATLSYHQPIRCFS